MTLLRIAVVGLDNWESKFIETTIAVASGIEIAQWQFDKDPSDADVLLVNAESHGGDALINRRSSGNAANRPVVVPCVKRETDGGPTNGGTLGRPISYSELITLLRDLEPGLRKATGANPSRSAAESDAPPAPAEPTSAVTPPIKGGEAGKFVPEPEATEPKATQARKIVPDTEPESDDQSIEIDAPIATAPDEPEVEVEAAPIPAASGYARTITAPPSELPDQKTVLATERYLAKMARPAKRFFEATRLLGLLKQSATQEKVIKLIHPAFPSITIFPRAQTYTSTADPTLIPEMFRVSALKFLNRNVDETFVAEYVGAEQCEPLWKLVYCAALFGSEGRLLARCNPGDELYLIDVPDFSVVPFVAQHRLIADHMQKDHSSLKDIALHTGVDIEIVIDFCNACEEIGLIGGCSVGDSRIGGLMPREGTEDASPDDDEDDEDTGSTSLLRRMRLLFK